MRVAQIIQQQHSAGQHQNCSEHAVAFLEKFESADSDENRRPKPPEPLRGNDTHVVQQHHGPDNHQNESGPQATRSGSQVQLNTTLSGFAELALSILVDPVVDVPVNPLVQVLADLIRVKFVFAVHRVTVSLSLVASLIPCVLFLECAALLLPSLLRPAPPESL